MPVIIWGVTVDAGTNRETHNISRGIFPTGNACFTRILWLSGIEAPRTTSKSPQANPS
jgi:hypothetical protein